MNNGSGTSSCINRIEFCIEVGSVFTHTSCLMCSLNSYRSSVGRDFVVRRSNSSKNFENL